MLAQLNRAARTRLVVCTRLASTARLVARSRCSSTGATSQEWKAAGLGAQWAPPETALTEIVFVQAGMGCDQHGSAGASKAATRACRQAIEFNALRRALIKLSRRVSATAESWHTRLRRVDGVASMEARRGDGVEVDATSARSFDPAST